MKRALRHMRRIYRNSSISHKLFLAFSLLVAVPAILIAFLFIRIQEEQLYEEAMTAGSSHVMHLNEQLRGRMSIIENVSSIALAQKSFVDYIHSDMRSDGLGLVKFRNNQFEQMRHIIQSNRMISQLSFYVDNPNVQEIWPEIYSYDRFWPQDYWLNLRDEGGSAYRLFAFKDGDHTLAYYRMVRLQSQSQKYPSIMEIRSSHEAFFGDLLDGTNSAFFSVVMDAADSTQTVYNANHPFAHDASNQLNEIFASIHTELDKLQQKGPIKAKIGDHTYYAQYHYIAPLDAYVVDLASRDVLLKGPRSWYVLVITVALIGLLLMLVLVSQITHRIFRRLDSVLSSMRKVRSGQLDAKIVTGLGMNESGDEIDEVAVSYNSMLDEIQRLMTQVVDKQLIAKNAQLHSLHSQINSHFLYNALESIRMLAEVERQPAIADALVTLGSLMRYSMKWRSDTVAFGEELTNIQSYVQFVNFMEGGGIELTANYPQEVLQYAIPKMCMQPIVENAVRHAVPTDGSLRIDINVRVDQHSLLIDIRDNGAGVDPQVLESLKAALRDESDGPITASKNGLGLENVHKRLQLHYGKGCGLSMESVRGSYTCVTIRLPWENENLGGW
jgi:Predicted signal transduction protein with a C-terminal ATPase domain